MEDDQGISDRGPARSAPRDSLFLLTSLISSEGEDLGKARIRNLSATGLMADCERPVAAGTRIELDLRGVGRVCGSVAWSRGDKIGVAFDASIDPQLARRSVTSGATPQMPDYLRTHQPPRMRR
ncbi:PilZ domain-containing protein [Sphingobium sp. TCM1]|uniref:PilZ domain-containing protein n=1 Tax=Sphingobium sp. TCM1 TaxID=453246 RepID=UPI0007F453CF|nr:PilZ domain-containing protein [Sphingobium sp. TCM1]OAN53583.1 pilus assembly protein PilZ [Sphingobium sp. TCM1]